MMSECEHKWHFYEESIDGCFCVSCRGRLGRGKAEAMLNEHASLTKKVERLEELPSLVPTTWLDPIFVGDNAVDTSKCDGQQVEALLLAIKKRLSDALLESER